MSFPSLISATETSYAPCASYTKNQSVLCLDNHKPALDFELLQGVSFAIEIEVSVTTC